MRKHTLVRRKGAVPFNVIDDVFYKTSVEIYATCFQLDRSLTVASPRSPTDSQKMKEKDRQIIKEKFAGFNKAMDEILR